MELVEHTKMCAQEVLNDPYVMRYVPRRDAWTTYYTCIPTDSKRTTYECFYGGVDTCYSDKKYDEHKWLEKHVPFYVPKFLHESYLNRITPDRCVRILKTYRN